MRTLIKLLKVLHYFNYISPVVMYYIYEDSPQAGYVDILNRRQSSSQYNFDGHREKPHFSRYDSFIKYAKDTNGQKLDSRFKVKKTVSKQFVQPIKIKVPDVHNNPDVLNKGSRQELQNVNLTSKEVLKVNGEIDAKPLSKSQIQASGLIQAPTLSKLYGKTTKESFQNQHIFVKPQISYDNHNSLKVNVHRTPIQTAPQKVRLNNNRQLTAVSIPGPANHYHKKVVSDIVDKTLQKNTNVSLKNVQIMSRILDDMTNKMNAGSKKSKRKVASDALKKYIGKDDDDFHNTRNSQDSKPTIQEIMERFQRFNNKLKQRLSAHGFQPKFLGNEKRKRVETTRIGGEWETKINSVPYALFYRINPEALLDPEIGFVPFEVSPNNKEAMEANKESRLIIRHEKANTFNKQVPIKGTNSVKLHKNYRKF